MKSFPLRCATLFLLLGITGAVSAANLQLAGNYSFSAQGTTNTVVLSADTIRNADTSGRSGSIRLELWAFTSPYAGGALNGYRMAIYSLSPLNAGSSWTKVSSGTTAFTSPPVGTYYVSMMVTEYTGVATNDGYFGRDYGNLSTPMVIDATGAGGGTGNLLLNGSMTYTPQNGNTTVLLQLAEVRNTAPSGRSGSLRLELWATASVYRGGHIAGYKLAQYALPSISAGSSLYGISSGSIPFNPPPAGTWNVSLVLTEYTGSSSENDGYSIVDYNNFPTPMTTGASSPSGGNSLLALSGRSTYTPQNGNTTVLLEAGNIRNNATSGTSGSLRLELWAFSSPYAGGSVSGQKLAQYQIAPLAAGASRSNLSSGSIPFTKPTAGTWYVSLLLTENNGSTLNNDGFSVGDYTNFPVPMVIASNTGSGNTVPISGPTYAAGGSTVFFIPDSNGSLWAIGKNQFGQLGDGSTTDRSAPVQVATLASSVYAGPFDTTVFVKRDGTAWGMGSNTVGSIGDGTTTNRSSPVLITAGVASAVVGGEATLFVKTDGSLWACGWNQSGTVGDGTSTMRLTPVPIATGVTLAAAGISHSLFRKADGTLWAMGSNTYGQLGDGTTVNRSTPVLVATGVAAMAAGYGHTVFLKTDGTFWAVGSNNSGQLGDGTNTDRHVPIEIAAGVVSVTAGAYHTLFVRTDGTLWAMGFNTNGALGDGTTKSRSVPVRIAAGVTSASGGYYHSVFRLLDGTLWGMGANSGQLGDGSNLSRLYPVPIGVYSPEALTINYPPISQSRIVGQTAQLSVTATGNLPLSYQWFKDGVALAGANGANLTLTNAQVANSGDYTVAVSSPSGTITTNAATLTVTLSPAMITSQPAGLTRSVSESASFAVTATGSTPITYQWQFNGANIAGATSSSYTISSSQIANRGTYTVLVTNPGGTITSDPVTLDVIELGSSGPIASADGGYAHTLFVTQSGELWGAGDGQHYQLGSDSVAIHTTPVRITTGVSHASASYDYTMYVKTDGTLWGVGSGLTGTGLYGIIGGTTYQTPKQVATGVANVVASYQHIIFSKTDGSLWGMGDNTSGQLGLGTVTSPSAPAQIVPSGVTAFAAGNAHSVFLKANGTLWAMGGTAQGQLGDNTPASGAFGNPETLRTLPVQVVASGVAAVAAGGYHTLFVKTDGTLWATGRNDEGQLGDGTVVTKRIPVQISTGVAAVYAGSNSSMFLKANGTLWSMGTGSYGGIYVSPQSAPVQIATGVSSAWIGDNSQRFWIKSDGSIWAMGMNGGLGDGSTTRRDSPVQIVSASPVVKAPPTSQSVTVGGAVTLTATVGASPAPALQWYKDGVALPGATASTYTVPSALAGTAGSYTVVATNSLGSATSAPAVVTVGLLGQSINFGSLPSKTYGGSGFTLTASASSGLPVSFASSNPSVATVNGATVTIVGAGATTLTATQSGNSTYASAGEEARTLTVAKVPITATAASQTRLYGAANPPLTISYSGTFVNNDIAAVITAPTASTTATPLSLPGTYPITLTGGSAANYSLTLVNGTLTVTPRDYSGAYFGTFGSGGHWALYVRVNSTATYIAYLPSRKSAIVASLSIATDGTFTVTGTEIVPLASAATVSGLTLASPEAPVLRTTAAAAAAFTLSGQIGSNGAVTGQLTGLGETLTGLADGATGSAPAGLYTTAALNTASGATYTIVAASGQAVVVTTTPSAVDGAAGTVNSSGQLTATTSNNAALTVSINASAQTASATLTPAGSSTPITYAGQSDTYTPVVGGHLVNLSSRAAVGTGDNVLIVGFVITGSVPKPVIIRGVGPALAVAPFNMAGTLPDPLFDLYRSGAVIAHNDNWATAGNQATVTADMARVGAFSLPSGSFDSVISTPLNPGVYSAILYGNGTPNTGVGMVEIYDSTAALDPTTPRMVNISSRGLVGKGDNVLIGGFVVTGDQPRQVLIRGVGPTLTTLGVTGAVLTDPIIYLYNSGAVINQNDNWGSAGDGAALSAAATAVGAFALPNGSKDAALLTALQPGVYSVIVAGVGNTTGIALVEVYEVGN